MDPLREISDRNTTDWARALLLIPLGLAFVVGVFCLFHFHLVPWVLTALKMENPARERLIVDIVLALAFLVDLSVHPTWPWANGRKYFMHPGPKKELESGDLHNLWIALSPFRPLGILKMLPLVAAFADPGNRGFQRLIFVGDLLTIPLFGSRIARAGFEHLGAAFSRGSVRNRKAAEALVKWMRPQGNVTEKRLTFQLSVEPDWVSGFALARNCDLLTKTSMDNAMVYKAK